MTIQQDHTTYATTADIMAALAAADAEQYVFSNREGRISLVAADPDTEQPWGTGPRLRESDSPGSGPGHAARDAIAAVSRALTAAGMRLEAPAASHLWDGPCRVVVAA